MKFMPTLPRQRLVDVVPLKTPYTMYIDPSGACNFKCGFCPCNNSDYRKEERHKIMDFSLFEKIVSDMEQFGEQVKAVSLYNFGEPLLNPRFIDMIKLLREQNVCRDIRCYTNASLITSDIADKMVKHEVTWINISIEAMSNDDYRSVTKTSITLDEIYKIVEYLFFRSRRSNTIVTCKIIATDTTTVDELQKFDDMFSSITDYCWWEPVQQTWVGYDSPITSIKDAPSKPRITCGEPNERKSLCSWPLTNLGITSSGKAIMCCNDWRYDTEIGDVNIESLSQIWNGDKLYFRRVALLKGERSVASKSCAECNLKSFDNIDADADLILKKLIYEHENQK